MQPARDARAALISWSGEGGSAQGRFRFGSHLPVFIGHFPGQPLLPGVYHLAAMGELAAVALPAARLHLQQVERAKWSAPAYPDRDLEVLISWSCATGVVSVEGAVRMAGLLCASARLAFQGVDLPQG